MIEFTTNPRYRAAFHAAHRERAAAFRACFAWLFRLPQRIRPPRMGRPETPCDA